jgi:hypothetical protein
MIRWTLRKLKPGAPRHVHLLLAATLWSVIGGMLMFRGVSWLITVKSLWIMAPALITGTMKSLFIIDNTTKKGVRRILELTDGTCLGAVYSVKTWLLVLLMMGVGTALRHSAFPRELLGGLYVAIGWALFFSSRHAWQQIADQWGKK